MVMASEPFHTPTYADLACRDRLLSAPLRCCEYTFANMMLWRRAFGTEIAQKDGMVLCRFTRGQNPPTYLAPVGGTAEQGLAWLREVAAEVGHPLRVFGYTDEMLAQLSDRVTVRERTEHPDEFDYLYRVEDLAQLPGRKYHGKRNHIAAFSRRYNWHYETLRAENAADVLAVADGWYAHRIEEAPDTDGALQSENEALHELLLHREEVRLVGGLIYVEQTPVAFAVGAPLCADTFDTLVEKALPEFGEAYAVINQQLAANELAAYTYVNRENDVGSEGLRRAKQSYHPVELVKKTLCTLEF